MTGLARRGTPVLVLVPDAAAAAREAQKRLRVAGREAVAARSRFTLALAGGSTQRALCHLLAEPDRGLDWERTEIFFCDERCVPPEHPESNYGMVHEALLSRTAIPSAHVHRMQGEDPDPARAAARYEAEMRSVLGQEASLDLVLLGIGIDGRTASLCPHTSVLDERDRLCVSVLVPGLLAHRLTLTYPVFEAAREVVFLVVGAEKAETLRAVIEDPPRPLDLPCQPVMWRDGATTLVCDRAAASELATARG